MSLNLLPTFLLDHYEVHEWKHPCAFLKQDFPVEWNDIYFCDPHSPWQRGSNENANGLIREYLPKGMDLSQVSHQQLSAIEQSLNHRPRKILNFHSPHEVFSALIADFIKGVALQP